MYRSAVVPVELAVRPVEELTKLLGKFKHLREEDLAILQAQLDQRFKILRALCAGAA